MLINFKDINYLKKGNAVQRKAYRILTENKILEILQKYNPIVVGTIPININIEGSDIDIILQTEDYTELENLLAKEFSKHNNYSIKNADKTKLVCHFNIENLPFEVYATNIETDRQNGYLHLLKEHEIIQKRGQDFSNQIKELKRNGLKTEPAFCKLLGIAGNPYVEILKYKI